MVVTGKVQLDKRGAVYVNNGITAARQSDECKVLLDSGALHASYVSIRWLNRHRESLNPERLKPIKGSVLLGDSKTKVDVKEMAILDLRVKDTNNQYHLCRTAFVAIPTDYDFIIGLPDLCTKVCGMFLKQFNLANRFITELEAPLGPASLDVQAALAASRAIPAKLYSFGRAVTKSHTRRYKQLHPATNILDNGQSFTLANEPSEETDLLYPWSNIDPVAPEELETEQDTPALFSDALNFMEQTVAEADAEYSEALRDNPKKYNELNNDPKFTKLMNEKGRQVYVPANWEGINMPPLHLNFHESMPASHHTKVRTIPETLKESTTKELTRLQQYHFLSSESPYASALVVAPKATTPFVRLCGDYRWINLYILIQHEWIPNVLDALKQLSGFKYYIDIDLTNAFHQIRLDKATSEKLSILTPHGLLRPKFLPEGVAPASAILQRYMTTIFKDFADHTFVIFDNVVIGADSMDQLLERYEKFLDQCIKYNVILKLAKSTFALRSVAFFGYVIDQHGWQFDIERLEGLHTYGFPDPSKLTPAQCRTLVQQFLGAANFFRPAYVHAPCPSSKDPDSRPLWVDLTSPLYDMTTVDFQWSQSDLGPYRTAFDTLKQALLACAKLYFPDYSLPWILRTDASSRGVGAILFQQRYVSAAKEAEKPGELVHEPIAVVSHKFTKAATRWATIKQELYGIYYAVSKLSHLLHGKRFIIETDHANLLHLEQSDVAILIRWRLYLQQYDFMLRHLPGKTNVVADAVSRQWMEEFEDEDGLTDSELSTYSDQEIAQFEEDSSDVSKDQGKPLVHTKPFDPEHAKHPPVSQLELSRVYTERIPEYDEFIATVHGQNNLHFGTETTWKKLNRVYPGHTIPRHYIDYYISQCGHCQKAQFDRRNNTTQPIIRHIVPSTIRTAIGIDMIDCGLDEQTGCRYAHVIVNMFSKYVMIYPAKTADAVDAARAILRYCATVGPVRELRSDPGSNYCSQVVKEFNNMVGIAHKVSLVDRHESNGVEPYNREIKRHLSTLLKEKRLADNWSRPEVIDLIQLELNTFPRRSTGNYDAMTLQYGTLDEDMSYAMDFTNAEAYSKFILDLGENQTAIRAAATKVRKEWTEALDAAVQNYTLHQKGDLVLARDSPKVGKTHGKYLGPYIVQGQRSNDVDLVHLSSHKRRTVHVSDVKAFHGDLAQATALAMEDDDEYELEEILYYEGNPLIRSTLGFHCKFANDDELRLLTIKEVKDTEALQRLVERDRSLLPLSVTTQKEADTLRKGINKTLLDRTLFDPSHPTVYLDVRCRAVLGASWYLARKFTPNQLHLAELRVEPKGHPSFKIRVRFVDRALTPWKSKPFDLTHFEWKMYGYTAADLDQLDHSIVRSTTTLNSTQNLQIKPRHSIHLATLNVNGLKNAIKKGLFQELTASLDHLALQEVKASTHQQDALRRLILSNSHFTDVYFNLNGPKGYAGVAICTTHRVKHATQELFTDPNNWMHTHLVDGRLLTLVFETHALVTAYVPFPKLDKTAVEQSIRFRQMLGRHVRTIEHKFNLPLILAADMNSVIDDLDLTLHNKSGVCASEPERDSLRECIEGYTDVYRTLHPRHPGHTAKGFGRHTNHRFRLDYIVVSPAISVLDTSVDADSTLSDHFALHATLRIPPGGMRCP